MESAQMFPALGCLRWPLYLPRSLRIFSLEQFYSLVVAPFSLYPQIKMFSQLHRKDALTNSGEWNRFLGRKITRRTVILTIYMILVFLFARDKTWNETLEGDKKVYSGARENSIIIMLGNFSLSRDSEGFLKSVKINLKTIEVKVMLGRAKISWKSVRSSRVYVNYWLVSPLFHVSFVVLGSKRFLPPSGPSSSELVLLPCIIRLHCEDSSRSMASSPPPLALLSPPYRHTV